MRFLPLFSLAALVVAPLLRAAPVEIPNAAQPQLAVAADGRVWLAFGRGQEIFVARSDDRGATFGGPVRVAALPSLMLGRRRGPRIAAHGDNLVVTAMAGELFAFRSKDGGKTWTGPSLVNDTRRSAREGLNDLAVAPDGRFFAVWLDLRGERTQLFSAESADGGATWSANQLVYRAPAGSTVCECCHPSARFNAEGALAVMWRNGIEGNRDMWVTQRPAGRSDFAPATKLGEGTWPLKACPMDGGAVFADRAGFGSVWMRAGEIFLARPGAAEQKLAAGQQPVATPCGPALLVAWQQGPDLWLARQPDQASPARHAAAARFPALISIPGEASALLAYEHGPNIVVEKL